MFRSIALPVLSILFVILAVVAVGTVAAVAQAQSECDATGGTFSVEGGTAWCRY